MTRSRNSRKGYLPKQKCGVSSNWLMYKAKGWTKKRTRLIVAQIA